jgi:hypothetical protein
MNAPPSLLHPLFISRQTAFPRRTNKARVSIASPARFSRPRFVSNASIAVGKWKRVRETAEWIPIAPICPAPMTVPCIPTNPYLRPINNVVRQMKTVPFPFPYIPQIVQLSVLTSVLLLFAGLFITIGLVTDRRRLPRAYSGCAETFAGGIGGGTECTGCEHWNFFTSVPSFLPGSAAILAYRLALEFASIGRTGCHGRSSIDRLRDHALLALHRKVSAFILVAQCYLFVSVPSRFATVIGSPGFVTLPTRS